MSQNNHNIKLENIERAASVFTKKYISKLVLLVFVIVTLIGTFYVVALAIFLAPTNERDNNDPVKIEEMEKLSLEWGRLAPFPKDAKDFVIKTEGSAFTRAFRGSFSAPKKSIDAWLKSSPGIQDVEVDDLGNQRTRYIIKAGGDAAHAEVTIDSTNNTVEFYTYWN